MTENQNLTKYPLMQYLTNASKIMMLNEFEISAWSVWLDLFDLDDDGAFTVEDFIFYTAFYLKLKLNDENYLESMFVSYFNCYINGFITKFNIWIKSNNKCFQFDPIKVNKKFQSLNAPNNPLDESNFVDFNNLVDDILNISPPYHTNAN